MKHPQYVYFITHSGTQPERPAKWLKIGKIHNGYRSHRVKKKSYQKQTRYIPFEAKIYTDYFLQKHYYSKMDWKRVIDNNITHASSTVENRYQQSFISLLSTSMFSLGTFKYCVVTFMKYFCCIKQKYFFCIKYQLKSILLLVGLTLYLMKFWHVVNMTLWVQNLAL